MLQAADPQLMKLVMPGVKVMSDVNVLQARLSPFGQFVLTQIGSGSIQQLSAATGFDPRQDLIEVLAVSTGASGPSADALVLASGVFNPAKILAMAAAAGAAQETYKGVSIVVGPKNAGGAAAFPSPSILIAGNLASVKAAIDRQASPASLPPSLVTQANQLSVAYDAWVLSTVSPASLAPSAEGKPQAIGGMNLPLNALQNLQSGYLGVKFGANVTVTAQAQSDTEENAAGLAGMLQFVGNLAQMQAAQNPDAAAFAKSLTVAAKGSTVNFSASLPEAQFQQLLTPKTAVKGHAQGERK